MSKPDGMTDKIKGTVKETAGKISGDSTLEAKGKGDKLKGAAKQKAGKAKDKLADKWNDAVDHVRHDD